MDHHVSGSGCDIGSGWSVDDTTKRRETLTNEQLAPVFSVTLPPCGPHDLAKW